jgi:DNA-binding transcriptional ArsR family regulator
MPSQEEIIKLTNAVYRVTGVFPEKEPLQEQIRQKANALLADFIGSSPKTLDKERIFRQIDVLLAYFSIAEQQNWVNSKNFAILAREYKKIRDSVNDFVPKSALKELKTAKKTEILEKTVEKPLTPAVPTKTSLNPSSRQKKIVELVRNKGEISLSELRDTFSGVCPRTLRRDLRALASNGVLDRIRQGRENVLFVLKAGIDSGQVVVSR